MTKKFKLTKRTFLIFIISFSFISLFALVFVLLYQNSILYDTYQTQLKSNQCILYNGINYKTKAVPNGLYWVGEDYYCVWAKDREISSIERTEKHEYCHYLIDNDFDHFCSSRCNQC